MESNKSADSIFKDPILRDFFVTKSGLIFSVPDYFHSKQGIRSVLRYIPDENGPRIRKVNGKRYKKAEFDESFDYLKKNHPDWVFDVAVVPRFEIFEILKPNDIVMEIFKGAQKNEAAKALIQKFKNAGVSLESMGISGSILPGLENEESDIDFLVYGKEWFLAREKLEEMKNETERKEIKMKNETEFEFKTDHFAVSELDDAMWKKIYEKRKSPLSFEDFKRHEIRKNNRGMLVSDTGEKIYFDLLFARSVDQIQNPIQRGKDTTKIIIEAVIQNDDFAFDSPAVYQIRHGEIDEIYSYTHTYTGQALKGEKVRARGMIEEIGNKKRLVIGTSREATDEWMISLSLLETQNRI